jgi:hypothetical protein
MRRPRLRPHSALTPRRMRRVAAISVLARPAFTTFTAISPETPGIEAVRGGYVVLTPCTSRRFILRRCADLVDGLLGSVHARASAISVIAETARPIQGSALQPSRVLSARLSPQEMRLGPPVPRRQCLMSGSRRSAPVIWRAPGADRLQAGRGFSGHGALSLVAVGGLQGTRMKRDVP